RISETSSSSSRRRSSNTSPQVHPPAAAQAQQAQPIELPNQDESVAMVVSEDQPIPPEFMYYNDAAAAGFVIGPQFGTEAFAEQAASNAEMANGAPIVLGPTTNVSSGQPN